MHSTERHFHQLYVSQTKDKIMAHMMHQTNMTKPISKGPYTLYSNQL